MKAAMGIVWGLILCFVVFATLLFLALAAQAEERTVSWYADHPGVLARVTAACRNDPGHGWNHPDCINAAEARIETALRHERAMAGDAHNPSYWQARPEQRVLQAGRCAQLPAQYREQNFCGAVAGR